MIRKYSLFGIYCIFFYWNSQLVKVFNNNNNNTGNKNDDDDINS